MTNHNACKSATARRPVILGFALVLALGLAIAGASVAWGSPHVAAQNATAAAAMPTLPAVPDASICTVTPHPMSDYHVMTGTPTPAPASYIITAGKPADQATIDAVTRTMIEVAACINTGNLRRLDSLYTANFFGTGEIAKDYYDFIATPGDPQPSGQGYGIYGVYAVQMLADGRVAAIFQAKKDGTGGVDLMIFAKVGDRWLIDKWVDGPFDIEPNFGPPATPTS